MGSEVRLYGTRRARKQLNMEHLECIIKDCGDTDYMTEKIRGTVEDMSDAGCIA